MNLKSVGVVLTACSVTLAAHGAIRGVLLERDSRMRARWAAEQEAAMTRVVRAELSPLQGEVARSHARIDQHLAMHAGRP